MKNEGTNDSEGIVRTVRATQKGLAGMLGVQVNVKTGRCDDHYDNDKRCHDGRLLASWDREVRVFFLPSIRFFVPIFLVIRNEEFSCLGAER